MPAATVSFSYAQAAKGQKTTSGSTSPALSSSVDPVASTPMSGTHDPESKDGSVTDVPAAAPAVDARNGELEAIRDSKVEAVLAAKAPSVSDASCTTNNDTLVSSGTSFNDSRRDDDTGSELSAQRSVKGPRSQGPAPRAAHSRPTSTGADSKRQRRERKPKGGANGVKNAEKDTDVAESPKEAPAPKPELFEAPIPTVNPWHQRPGSQSVTTKPVASQPAAVSAPNLATAPAQTSARKGAAATGGPAKPVVDRSSTNGVGSQRRSGDGDAPRKNGPPHKNDSRRVTEQVSGNDSAHWPTPDTISKEEKPQKSADKSVETQETPVVQDDQAPQKGKQPKKDWVKMDFVPSVNFETPLPQHKGARPRGGARGGRGDGTTRGGHSNAAKDGEKGSSASASSAKANGETREGPRDVTAHSRGSSVPPTSTKRGSTDAPAVRDQRKHAVPAAAKTKESAVNDQPRDKHEVRGERTRGAPRGRGGYHASTSQLNAQHAPFTTGYAPGVANRQQNQYSPPIRQNQFNSYGSASARGGASRGGRAGANAARASGSSNGNARHAPSSVMTYDHAFHGTSMMGYPQAPSPAFFFDPYLVSTLTTQLSWYFSIQNLCRDLYLRGNMDSQGFVPLSLVAGFNRVSTLLQAAHDPVQYVRQACMASRDVEFVVGDDGVERLRTLNNHQHWILPMEDRCESAQTSGPATFYGAGQQYPAAHQGVVHGGFPSGAPAPMNSYPPYSESQANAFSGPASPDHGPELANGIAPGHGTEASQNTTLKPTVAEFSPRNGAADGIKDQVVEGTDLTASAESPADLTPATVEVSENGQDAASS